MGVAGALTSDSLFVGVLNRGGNKLDQFLRVNADLSLTREKSTVHAVLRLELRNTARQGEPSYIAGPNRFSGVGPGVETP